MSSSQRCGYTHRRNRKWLSIALAAIACLQAPAAESNATKADHWAFRPALRPAVPHPQDEKWLRNPIDNFILTRLESERLAPGPEADRRTLIRRLSFDLTGLPPEPEEVDQFLADRSSNAYEALVDRLLNSPRYGERWARHWLDVVHYGESHGYDKDKPRLNAWPYRDYVIRAINHDKPYSRFVEEQLAGDVLFPDDADGVIATGFIAAGPWDYVGHVELPESKTDGLIARYNDRDDMVMTTLSTFQSLTVHCARCHDHKFDPISQEEYYRLQAVFAGVDRANRAFDTDPTTAARRRALTSDKRRLERRLKDLAAAVAAVTSPEIERLGARLIELNDQSKQLPKVESESTGNGYHSKIAATPDVEKWVQVDLPNSVLIDEVRLIPARPTDFADTPGFGFPKRFRVEVSDDETFSNRQMLLDQTTDDHPNPGDKTVSIPVSDIRARFVRVTATRLWERTKDYVFALAELQVLSGTNNVAAGAGVSALDSIEAGRWSKVRLVDNFDSRKSLVELAEPADIAAKRRLLDTEIRMLSQEREFLVQALVDSETKRELAETKEGLERLKTNVSALPEPRLVYAASSDFKTEGSFAPPGAPRPVYLLKRGDVKRPGPLMSAGALACVPGVDPEFNATPPDDEGSRRAALAKWITDPKNMLTRRSIVNRVWQYHFGRGIVDTPNDFGHMGSLPTHPELLDWLAFWFLDNGESLKKLHQLIVTSATYRQTSNSNTTGAVDVRQLTLFSSERNQNLVASAAAAEKIDAGNRYLWRINVQRLDAESFRDALLRVSGRLDLSMDGPSVQQFVFKDDHSPVYDYTQFNVDSPASYRRSIYRFIVRSVADPFMECLDSADPSLLTARRNVTVTALQALATLNHPFVIRQCEHFAERLQQSAATLDGQIEQAYRIALNRKPTSEELQMMGRYAARHGLVNACRLLVNSNEFMFID